MQIERDRADHDSSLTIFAESMREARTNESLRTSSARGQIEFRHFVIQQYKWSTGTFPFHLFPSPLTMTSGCNDHHLLVTARRLGSCCRSAYASISDADLSNSISLCGRSPPCGPLRATLRMVLQLRNAAMLGLYEMKSAGCTSTPKAAHPNRNRESFSQIRRRWLSSD